MGMVAMVMRMTVRVFAMIVGMAGVMVMIMRMPVFSMIFFADSFENVS